MAYTSWIKSEIARVLGVSENALEKGVDLDRNGRVEGKELLEDSNQNGHVGDYQDWVAYFQEKVRTRPEWNSQLGGIFRHATGSPLSLDNSIHDSLGIESPELSPECIKTVYARIPRVLTEVRKRDAETGGRLPPREKLRSAYQAIRDSGFRSKGRDNDPLLATAVCDLEVDCDSSALIVLAVAHEMYWPVSLVLAPHHAFVRWEEPGLTFNMDLNNWGTSLTDREYVNLFSITDQSRLREGAYLRSLDRNGLLAAAFERRASARINRLDQQEGAKTTEAELIAAKEDISQALALDARNPRALFGLAWFSNRVEGGETTLRILERVLQMDPHMIPAIMMLAELQKVLKNDEEVIEVLEVAIRVLDLPGSRREYTPLQAFELQASSHLARAHSFEALGRYQEAADSVSKGIDKMKELLKLDSAEKHDDPRLLKAFNDLHRWHAELLIKAGHP